MGVQQEFNDWQSGYTEKVMRWVPHYPALLESVVTGLPDGFQPRHILDLGGGNGNAVSLLHHRFPDASYTLLDASDEMLSAAKQRFKGNRHIQYIEAFFEEASFDQNRFDLIVAVLSIHHLPLSGKYTLFQKIQSWLSPGGIFSYSDLFASKHAPNYVDTVLNSWKAAALDKGTTQAEWAYLMDHHAKFDFPDSLEDTLKALKATGLWEITVTWNEDNWGNIRMVDRGE